MLWSLYKILYRTFYKASRQNPLCRLFLIFDVTLFLSIEMLKKKLNFNSFFHQKQNLNNSTNFRRILNNYILHVFKKPRTFVIDQNA
jgi:hypothetical protein